MARAMYRSGEAPAPVAEEAPAEEVAAVVEAPEEPSTIGSGGGHGGPLGPPIDPREARSWRLICASYLRPLIGQRPRPGPLL